MLLLAAAFQYLFDKSVNLANRKNIFNTNDLQNALLDVEVNWGYTGWKIYFTFPLVFFL